jgi:23S rRNA (cytosine1962-C5)-methyltransferase
MVSKGEIARSGQGRERTDRARDLCLLTTPGPADYSLLDSGNGRKLERFGEVLIDRPEPQALWSPAAPRRTWEGANAVFSASADDEEKGRWRFDRPTPDAWHVGLGPRGREQGAPRVLCRLQGLWHVGLFPEQLPHWRWMGERLAAVHGERPRLLNLFGYTGAASLLAAAAGAEVTHVDASRKAIQWGKENQAASGLADRPIRWLVDDARKFAAREVRRARTYDLILVDPPKFGRGPEGEVWDLFADLGPLLSDCARLLAPAPTSALVLTVYAIRASAIAFDQLVRERLAGRSGRFECGELALVEESAGRLLPTSLFTRWQGGGTP